jgi:hypothetical protein
MEVAFESIRRGTVKMEEEPKLEVSPWVRGNPLSYICSACGQEFVPPEDRDAKDGMLELLETFHEHIREAHGVEKKD